MPSILRKSYAFLKTNANTSQLWTDDKSRDFIATEYPWFLDNFDSYPFPIQRADAIRYFVLAHFGGIYILVVVGVVCCGCCCERSVSDFGS